MLKQIFTKQRQFINYFFDSLDLERAELILNEFLACQGMLIFTGIGKSGIIADKLAKTMISTGTKALYLAPLDAAHGDIGILSEKDLLIIISKSGSNEEILNIAKLVKKRGLQIMGWISSKNSLLAPYCHLIMYLPLEGEICPFDLAPTTSTAVQLIFGDVLAVALMQAKKFSLDQYALNHPAGVIGKLIAQHVEDVMNKGDELPICQPHQLLKDVLVELSHKKCGCLLVVDNQDHLQGIFTDGDLRRALKTGGEKILLSQMGDLMTKNALTTSPNTPLTKALKSMEGEKKVMMMPVVKEKKLVGLVHIHHILSKGIALRSLEQKKSIVF